MKGLFAVLAICWLLVWPPSASADRVPGSPFPVPSAGLNASSSLFLIDPTGSPGDDLLTLATLQGLLSRTRPTLFRSAPGSAYDTWRDELTRTWGVTFDTSSLPDVWAALARFAPNVTGFVIADLTDGSVNAAVALCSAHGAVAVSARTAPRAASLGLPLIADARGRDLEWVLATLGTSRFSAKVSLIQDPKKTGMSDVAIAFNALPWYVADANASTGAAPRIWGALSPPFAALGWGPDERGTVAAASRAGGGVIASDWAMNLDVLSAFDVPAFHPPLVAAVPGAAVSARAAAASTHTAAFLMSDGDNVQWLLGGFATDAKYWGSPDRGAVPMGWTVSSATADLAPALLSRLYREATPRDALVGGLSGASYAYLDDMAADSAAAAAELTLAFARKAGFTTLNVMTDSNAPLAQEAADALLSVTSPLNALFVYEYDNYAGLHGSIRFSTTDRPIIGARFNLWGDGTQGGNFFNISQAAAALAGAARDPTSADGYSLIVVHAWSHNVTDARAVAELTAALAPGGVDFVTPTELAARVAANVKRGP